MINVSQKKHPSSISHEPNWKKVLRDGFKNYKDLASFLDLPITSDITYNHFFPMRIPLGFARRIKKGDINDPLLKQVVPLKQELINVSGFSSDPLEENRFTPIPGLLHKYKNRVLLITHPACAVHCRYCFRREFDYTSHRISQSDWHRIFSYIQEHTDIEEVILSGGDPLMHNTEKIIDILQNIQKILHISRLRIHTRIPVVLPERITSELMSAFNDCSLQKVMVIHANHANEIALDVQYALQKLVKNGFILLNQSTLLKGVNNNAETLKHLSDVLLKSGVLPYYLHQLDKVHGAHHFRVSDREALSIHAKLKAITSGYLVPKLVNEAPNRDSKTWL